MSCTSSLKYAAGKYSDKSTPHYFVELDYDRLSAFEIPNSICLLDHYDHLLLFYESQIENGTHQTIPLFDIIVVLITLGTVSDHYKDQSVRSNDPYNITRISLGKRAIELIRFYVNQLKEFNCTKYGAFNLELLRCQFFLIIDKIFNEVDMPNPYKAYVSCLEQKKRVLGNELLTSVLSRKGEFLNVMLWTLSNSLSREPGLFASCHDIWIPILDVILDLVELRHDYFLKNEFKRSSEKISAMESFAKSPLFRFFKTIDSSNQFAKRFGEYLFIMCDYKSNIKNSMELSIHPVYRSEDVLSRTYVARVRYSEQYKLNKVFLIQRKMLKMCFRIYLDIPAGSESIKSEFSPDNLIDRIADILAELNDVRQLEAFFFSPRQSLHVMPLLAQRTLDQIISNFVKLSPTKCIAQQELHLAQKLGDADSFLSQCIFLYRKGLFLMWNQDLKQNFFKDNMKADICLLVLIERLQYLNGKSTLIDSRFYDEFVAMVNKNDSDRRDIISCHFTNSNTLNFHSAIVRLLNV